MSDLHPVGLTPELTRKLLADGGRGLFKDDSGKPPAAATGDLTRGMAEWLHTWGAPAVDYQATAIVEVSPSLANNWLNHNERNRKPSARKIKRYAQAMRDGLWELNGETIKFSSTGRLIDGQSRLQAVVESDATVKLEIRVGLPDAAQESMDAGEVRTLAHELEMLGYKDCNNLQTALRMLFFYLTYDIYSSFAMARHGSRTYFNNRQGRELLEQHEGIIEGIRTCTQANLKELVPPSRLGFLLYLFRAANPTLAEHFIEGLECGAGLEKTSPVFQLRDRLQRFQLERAQGHRIKPLRVAACIILAWNACMNGLTVKKIDFSPDHDAFPEIEGNPLKGES